MEEIRAQARGRGVLDQLDGQPLVRPPTQIHLCYGVTGDDQRTGEEFEP